MQENFAKNGGYGIEYCEDQQSEMSSSIRNRRQLLQELQEALRKDPSFINDVIAVLPTTSTDDKNNTHTTGTGNTSSICLLSEHQCSPYVKNNAEDQEPSMAAKSHDSEEESNLSTTDRKVNKMSEMENNFELMKPVIKHSTFSNSSTSKNEFMKTRDSTKEEYADERFSYSMNHPKRGYAVIFSHKRFLEHLHLNERYAANIDAEKLRRTFERFGFTTEVYMDKKYREIMEILNNLSEQDHSDEDCLVVAISTSGKKGFLMAADMPYKPEELWTPFIGNTCPHLAGKPKLFFIEASRGEKFDRAIDVPSRKMTDSGHSIHTEHYRIPSYADLIIMNSSVEGFYSWSNRLDGSWFITALRDVLSQSNGSEDLLTLLHQVSGKVALEYESFSVDSNISRCKQVPSIRSTLTKKLYLKSKVPMGQQLTEKNQISEYKTSSSESSTWGKEGSGRMKKPWIHDTWLEGKHIVKICSDDEPNPFHPAINLTINDKPSIAILDIQASDSFVSMNVAKLLKPVHPAKVATVMGATHHMHYQIEDCTFLQAKCY
ncbi:caspase-3 [Anabrus simplex]|uniref:caspase-3 n=1 Tax=Anabrus simplex TaxID=316456 RepID=UPI0035A34503